MALFDWVQQHPTGLLSAIFLVSFCESLAIIGLVVPGVAILFSIGLIAGPADIPIAHILFVAALGGFLGDSTSFSLGKYLKSDIHKLPVLKHHPEWISRGENFFNRYGIYSILLGRFIGPLRPIVPMLAGMLEVPRRTFVLISLSASLPWAMVYCLPGYWAGQQIAAPLDASFGYLVFIGMIIFAELIYRALTYTLSDAYTKKRSLGLLCLIALSLLVFIPLKIYGLFNELDLKALHWMQNIQAPSGTLFFEIITLSGDLIMILIYCIILLCTTQALNQQPVRSLTLIPGCFIITYFALKFFIDLPRPSTPLITPPESNTFPAGHAFFSMLLAGLVLSRSSAKLRLFSKNGLGDTKRISQLLNMPRMLIYWAGLVGLSRLYLQVHWVSDVFFSFLFSALCILTNQYIFPARQPAK